jgi:hypothetical protein
VKERSRVARDESAHEMHGSTVVYGSWEAGAITGCIFRAAQDRASKDVSLWVKSNYLHKRLCLGIRQKSRSRRRRSNLLHSMAANGCARGKLETG